jgi:hypothetical protein
MLVFGDVSLKSMKKNYLSLLYVSFGSNLRCELIVIVCLEVKKWMMGMWDQPGLRLGHDEMMNDQQWDQANPQETKRIRWLGATLTTTLKTYFIGHLYDGDWMFISKYTSINYKLWWHGISFLHSHLEQLYPYPPIWGSSNIFRI